MLSEIKDALNIYRKRDENFPPKVYIFNQYGGVIMAFVSFLLTYLVLDYWFRKDKSVFSTLKSALYKYGILKEKKTVIYCDNCGACMKNDKKFCPQCGHKVC